jgi:uracil-DNA glycosylase
MKYESFAKLMGEWTPYLKEFIESEEMDKIYGKLKTYSKDNKILCPESKNVFKALELTSKKDLSVIWVLADPYPWVKNNIMLANGIAMDCTNTQILQPSLDLFYAQIEEEIYDGLNINMMKSPSLEYLLKQGVMLLNSDLTCEANKPGSHKGLWEPFMKYLIEEVLSVHTGLIYVLSGKNSESLEKYINPLTNYIIKTEHPAAAAHKHRQWNSDGVFKKINYILKQNNNLEIFWDKSEYEEKHPPF